MKTLIVGCSYVENIALQNIAIKNLTNSDRTIIDSEKFVLKGKSGSGNQAIAARVFFELSREHYDNLLIFWSGINRLDFPIGKELHKVLPTDSEGNPEYNYFTVLGRTVWYHSGGFGLSGQNDPSPKFLQNWLSQQYKSADSKYLTQMTALSILQVQALVKSKNINCQMSFIYDIDRDYTNDFHNRRYVEPGCGMIDRTSELVSAIDWDMFTREKPPYESGLDDGRLYDGFHPDFDYMLDWCNRAFGINLRD